MVLNLSARLLGLCTAACLTVGLTFDGAMAQDATGDAAVDEKPFASKAK